MLGVEDDGRIVGVDHPAEMQEQLANSIANRIKPQLLPDFHTTVIENKSILALQIEQSYGPYYLSDKGIEKSVYIRIGNSNHLAGLEVIEELKRLGHYASFDKAPCDKVIESDLDMEHIKSVYGKQGRFVSTEKLISIGILVKKGKHLVATNGGVILFGLPSIRENYFPYAEVRCARFKGTSRSEFIDRLNIEGGILSAVEEVPKFIRRNTKMFGKFGSMRRRDIPEYPVNGIREALTNALVHANYEVSGTRIFVAIYDDRLEIQNPGIMLPGMSIDQFKAGVSRVRNPVIARTFGALELIEEWGSGYKRIKEACEGRGYPMPQWEEFGSALGHLLPIFGANRTRGSWHPVGTQLGIDKEMLQLLTFCRKGRSFQEMLTHMGWQDRTKFRRRFVLPLLEKGLISRTIPEKPSSSKQQYLITAQGLHLLAESQNKPKV